ncbi:MAG: GRAM domain-containing protein [archaeon]|nr:GRAM domain-containing protein [archaeon]
MALNPQLNQLGDPIRIEGEFFVMKRDGIEFEFKVQNGNKYTGKGYMILTTLRLICINTKSSSFKAFDLPLSLTKNEKFEQPIFGANYLVGTCSPLLNSLPGIINWKIWFMEGGCGVFVPNYLKMVYSMRKNQNRGIDSKMENTIKTGGFKRTAIVDPSDPSVIYLEQPQCQGNPNQGIEMGYIVGPPPSNPSQYMPLSQNPMNQQYMPSAQPNPNQYMPNQSSNYGGMQSNYMGNTQEPQMNPNYQPNQVENNYPSLEDINANLNNTNPQYPQGANNMQALQGMNLNSNENNQSAPRYFGFFGPQLQQTGNNPQRNNP